MQEEALRSLVFRKNKDEVKKNLREFGTDRHVENESDGNEDILGDLGL